MSLTLIVSLIGLLSVGSAVYTGIDLWRKRTLSTSVEVVSSAVQLLKPYKEELAEVNSQLANARVTIKDLGTKLDAAELRAHKLSLELDSARSEISYLRAQVNLLTSRFKDA